MYLTNISEILGQRIRFYRKQRSLSQEDLAELAELHPTYIGQIERGEKNASIETIYKISNALNIPIVQLLEKIDEYPYCNASQDIPTNISNSSKNIPLKAYELLSLESIENQQKLLDLLNCALLLKK